VCVVNEDAELNPICIRDRIGVEQTRVVPIAATIAAVETTFRLGDESERIDFAKTADER
jgi:hypothetical protein